MAEISRAPVTRLLCFSVSGIDCALPLSEVREVIAYQVPRSMPQRPPGLLGLVNLRGAVMPVVDLAARMQLATVSPGPEAAILIVSHGDRRVGLLVQRMEAVLPIASDDWSDPPGFTGIGTAPCFDRIAKFNGDRLILVLNLAAVLGEAPISTETPISA